VRAAQISGHLAFLMPGIARSPRGYVMNGVFDHTSVLNMIEWRWNLRPLTVRDATAQNLALALDFSATDLTAPQYAVPPGPFGSICNTTVVTPFASPQQTNENWDGLRSVALQYGWPVG
jgi:phospholipase C